MFIERACASTRASTAESASAEWFGVQEEWCGRLTKAAMMAVVVTAASEETVQSKVSLRDAKMWVASASSTSVVYKCRPYRNPSCLPLPLRLLPKDLHKLLRRGRIAQPLVLPLPYKPRKAHAKALVLLDQSIRGHVLW